MQPKFAISLSFTMDVLDAVLNIFYVDYLGVFESEPGHLETHHDAMKFLLDNGVDKNKLVINGELSIDRGQLVLRDTSLNVSISMSKISLVKLWYSNKHY